MRLKASLFLLALFVVSATRGSEPYGLTERAAVGPFLSGGLPPKLPEPGLWRAVNAFPALTFSDPVGLIPEPGSSRLCVYTRHGRVYCFESDPSTANSTLILDISARTQSWDDCGLLGMAFHPEFGRLSSTNRGYFYIFYQFSEHPTSGPERPPRTTPSYNRLSRFTIPDGATAADPNSELILIDQYDQDVWHNGGSLLFHPTDGFLYLTLGDEGGLDAQYGNTQLIDKKLFSGVIRIDVDQDPAKSHPIRRHPLTEGSQPASRTANYFIPDDNPFLDANGGVLEEFWSIGLRSPHRMSCDPLTGMIWLGDIGVIGREEVNIIQKGGNYQWGYREGTLLGPVPVPTTLIGVETPPVYDYPRDQGDITVIGGYVYRGALYAQELAGQYVFGDNGSGRIWALQTNAAAPPTVTYLCNMPPGYGYTGLSSFGVDHNREIYMCQMGQIGRIYKLERTGEPGQPAPPLLSQTGAFSELRSLTPMPALIPYDVNSPLWSDGAVKTRWMAVPHDGPPYSSQERISFAPTGEWAFPEGTVFVKHFELPLTESDPDITKRLETRFLVRATNGAVYGVTYKWRPDESEADLLNGAVTEELSVDRTLGPLNFSNSRDIGGPQPGSVTFNPGEGAYTIQAGGADIWADLDQFHLAYQEVTGDFDIKARIDSLARVDLFTHAGLMARESVAPDSRHVFAVAFPDNEPRPNNTGGYEFKYREATGGPTQAVYPPPPQPNVAYPNTWLRLKRSGNLFTAYAGSDGISWIRYASHTLALPETLLLGMAVNSHNTTQTTTARFSDFAQVRGQTWYYPSPQDCITCHSPVANHVLGVKTHQLNGLFTYPTTGQTDNQLRTLNHLSLFDPPLSETDLPNYSRLVAVTDTTASLEDRVRSYLAANCAQCHRPNGVSRASFDARFETPLLLQGIVNGVAIETLGISGARVVAPDQLSKSIMHLRISRLGDFQMPPLARNTMDHAALATFTEWINSLPATVPLSGLRAEYFDEINLTGLKLTRTDEVINFNWGVGSPSAAIAPDTFSVRWTGVVETRFSETYTFYTRSDDGVRLWIDGQLLIDNWIDHAAVEDAGSVALMAGQKYDLRMEYYEHGLDALAQLSWSSSSQPKELIPPGQLSPAAHDWLDQDIGGVGLTGLTTSEKRDFTLAGAGADIWDFADAFHFVYRSMNGDGEIVVRVDSLENTHDWAKAGVMMRQDLQADSPHALMAITSGHGTAFQRRISPGAISLHTPGPLLNQPAWVRLRRALDTFTGSVSSDGNDWVVVGSQEILMNTTLYVGLAVTSHDNTALTTALFSELELKLDNFPAPILAAQRLGGGELRLQITGPASGSYTLERSRDLLEWSTLKTFVHTNGLFEFIQPRPSDPRQLFYRVIGTR